MAKQLISQKYVLKIHSARLRRAKWDLTLPISEARRNGDLISLGDSLLMRWIDELNGVNNLEERIRDLKCRIRHLRQCPDSVVARHESKKLYAVLDELQYKQDIVHLVIDRNSDLSRACRGFVINGIRYVRLLGTPGGLKNSTVVFINEKHAYIIRNRIENGRNRLIPQIPAKLEAYRALTCSGSTPLSMPSGVLVVNDCVTHFKEDVLYLDDERDGDPSSEFKKDYDFELTESDGYGLMTPALAERWSHDVGLNYTACGINTRNSWEKGMVFCFDFHEFADKVAGSYIVKDAWGTERDIRNIELILTTSMLKLWKCYDSWEHYMKCCSDNHYTFSATKTSPEELENYRNLNYQFIQSYHLTDEQIMELIQPTIDEIDGVLRDDYRSALVYLTGGKMDANAFSSANMFAKALMINPYMYNDSIVKRVLDDMIHERINDAKIGVIGVHGNYSIMCGDPYALCQSIFGLEVTGLLKAGEIYNRYWLDCGATQVAAFRAPMS